LLERAARCDSPRCAWTLLRTNDFDAVDGLVLNRRGRGSYLTVTVDAFPDGWTTRTITFDRDLWATPFFQLRSLDGTDVVAPAH
jgi:hypothetical protein